MIEEEKKRLKSVSSRFVFDLAIFIKEHQRVGWEDLRAHFKCNPNVLNLYLTRLIRCGFIEKSGGDTIPVSYPIFEYVPLQKEIKNNATLR